MIKMNVLKIFFEKLIKQKVVNCTVTKKPNRFSTLIKKEVDVWPNGMLLALGVRDPVFNSLFALKH